MSMLDDFNEFDATSSPDFNFVVDRIINDKVYPALARQEAVPYTQEWREFVKHWPYTVPCELINYCYSFKHKYSLHSIDNFPKGSYYPIGLGFFDFTIDYFDLLPKAVFDAVKSKRLQILFYYHEGDNPHSIKQRLDELCSKWDLDTSCYRFVSGNTEAKNIPGFVYFPDHELLYRMRNYWVKPLEISYQPRSKDFTILNRTHKWLSLIHI